MAQIKISILDKNKKTIFSNYTNQPSYNGTIFTTIPKTKKIIQ